MSIGETESRRRGDNLTEQIVDMFHLKTRRFAPEVMLRCRGHNARGRGPFELKYYEACLNKEDARQREKYLKSGMGKRYLKKWIEAFPIFNGVK